MLLKIKENSINPAELNRVLSDEYEDKYKVSKRGKESTVIAKDKMIGTIVTVTKKRVYVIGDFPSMTHKIISILLFIILGVLIPLTIYFIFFHKKIKQVEKEVGAFVKENYRAEIIT